MKEYSIFAFSTYVLVSPQGVIIFNSDNIELIKEKIIQISVKINENKP